MRSEFKLPEEFYRDVHSAITQHLNPRSLPVDYIPTAGELAEVVETALWASVLTDEGRRVVFTLSLRPAQSPSRVMPLKAPLSLTPENLAKLAMATNPRRSALHVGPSDVGLSIFGIDTLVGTAAPVRLEVRAPANLAIKSAGATVAFISGQDAELIDLGMYGRYFFDDTSFPAQDHSVHRRERMFFDIAEEMHSLGHGGTLLVIEPHTDFGNTLHILYEFEQPFDGLRAAHEDEASALREVSAAQNVEAVRMAAWYRQVAALRRQRYVESTARTTSVDGATVVTSDGTVLGFGSKIMLKGDATIFRGRPTLAPASKIGLAEFGGTRHQSAARFVAMHAGSRAIVASQDGKVSFLKHRETRAVDCLEHAEWLF